MNLLVTGAGGFLGKNLCTYIETGDFNISLLRYDVENNLPELKAFLGEADAVAHLAGVNRPDSEDEYVLHNTGLTREIIRMLDKQKKAIPFIMVSSVQAEGDTPYGLSKRKAEEEVMAYAERTGAACCVFRLPSVFGKWCRPNYNSLVATWCYNIACGREIYVEDREEELDLVYVTDVVEAIMAALNGELPADDDGYYRVPDEYSIEVGQLADLLLAFKQSRETLIMPSLHYRLDSFLYATYLSYLPEDEFAYQLDTREDERGWLAEFIKSEEQGQIFISMTKPGITRGNQWHQTKVEKFLVLRGKAIIAFRRTDLTDVIEYTVSGDKLTVVDVPVGYTHSIKNVGEDDLITLFWAGEMFDPENPDTEYMDVYLEV